MSTADSPPEGPDGDRERAPGAGLEWLCDDPEDCQRVTLFDPDGDSPTTEWITVDSDLTVPLEEYA